MFVNDESLVKEKQKGRTKEVEKAQLRSCIVQVQNQKRS